MSEIRGQGADSSALQRQDTTAPARDALMKLYDLAVQQKTDWMHFHELAIRDPFKAEAEAQALCDDVRRMVIEAGVIRGHQWRPYEHVPNDVRQADRLYPERQTRRAAGDELPAGGAAPESAANSSSAPVIAAFSQSIERLRRNLLVTFCLVIFAFGLFIGWVLR